MNETGLVVEASVVPSRTLRRDARVWLCNWGAGEVLAVTTDGERQSALTFRFDDRGVQLPKEQRQIYRSLRVRQCGCGERDSRRVRGARPSGRH